MHRQASGVEFDFRPQPSRGGGRHRAVEELPAPVPAPAWANEHARPIPALVGERATAVIPYLARLTPAVQPEEAEVSQAASKPSLLGQCLHALGIRRLR